MSEIKNSKRYLSSSPRSRFTRGRFLRGRFSGGGFSRDSWLRYPLVIGLVLFFCGLTYVAVVTVDYLLDRPSIAEQLEGYSQWLRGTGEHQKRPSIRIYATDNSLIGQYLPERGSWLTLRSCEKLVWLRRAAVAAEDRRFYEHGGVSLRDMIRALRNNLVSFSIREGGGTITQQLARNLFTDRKRTLYRKIYETYVALQIESLLTKEEILCLYLNKIYMGEGRIGAEEASWFYFKKPPDKLTAAEAALIVGLFPSPVNYSPLNNLGLSLKKQEQVLAALVEASFLDSKERWKGLNRFLRRYAVKGNGEADAGKIGLYGASRDFLYNAAPTANQYVKNFLYQQLPEKLIRLGGLKVYTSIDIVRQRAASQVMRSFVRRERERLLTRNRRADPQFLRQLAKRLNGVFISLNAENGDIQAVVGGYDVAEGGMTQRIWSMRRQPGSSIKGFLYAAALEEGEIEPDMELLDEPLNIAGYRPRNWNKSYLGPVSLRQAVAMSINTVAVRTLNELGVSTFRSYLGEALHLGYSETKRRFKSNLSLALGSGEVSPLELALLYAPLANGGYLLRPEFVRRVESASGKLLWPREERFAAKGRRIFSQETTFYVLELMQGVFEPQLGGTAAFIGKRRNRDSGYLPFQVAGKTGTVQIVANTRRKFPNVRGYRDAWFVGLAPGEVDVVWFGQDEGAPIKGGGVSAASAWAQYAQRALKGRVKAQFDSGGSFWDQLYDFPIEETGETGEIKEREDKKEREGREEDFQKSNIFELGEMDNQEGNWGQDRRPQQSQEQSEEPPQQPGQEQDEELRWRPGQEQSEESQPTPGQEQGEELRWRPGREQNEESQPTPGREQGEEPPLQPGREQGEESQQKPGREQGEEPPLQPGREQGEEPPLQPGREQGEESQQQPGREQGEEPQGQQDLEFVN